MSMECSVRTNVAQNLNGKDDTGRHGQSAGGDVRDGGQHHRERLLGGLQAGVICPDAEHYLQERDAEEGFRGGIERAMVGELMQDKGRDEEDGERHDHRKENVREDSDGAVTEGCSESDLS